MSPETIVGVLTALMLKKDLIESALKKQQGEGFTFNHIFDMVISQRMYFFWNDTSCAIIEIRKYPSETNLHVFLGAGTTQGLLELYDLVAEWGKTTIGATKMTTLCRKGFKRTLAQHGWKEPQVWLTKELGKESK